ncbi:MAG: hypothetical protein ACRC8S_09560 [Fimbriiglobus sp.]
MVVSKTQQRLQKVPRELRELLETAIQSEYVDTWLQNTEFFANGSSPLDRIFDSLEDGDYPELHRALLEITTPFYQGLAQVSAPGVPRQRKLIELTILSLKLSSQTRDKRRVGLLRGFWRTAPQRLQAELSPV